MIPGLMKLTQKIKYKKCSYTIEGTILKRLPTIPWDKGVGNNSYLDRAILFQRYGILID